MSILIDGKTNLLVQGITGREASMVTKDMKAYGTRVVAGVTPGKGGQEVEGVPVYDTVKEAVQNHSELNASLIYVPPFAAKDAALEAIANGIPLLDIITERVPVHDTRAIVKAAWAKKIRVVGPTSVGILSPGKCKVGPIGGNRPEDVYMPGPIGMISKSGGMTTETSWVLRHAGFGQSTAMGLGGDVICGTAFKDALELFEQDKETKAVVLFGELGGSYEEQAAQFVKEKGFTKPLVAFVAGKFTETLPQATFGHAGAIIEGNTGTPSGKMKALKEAGALVAEVHHQIPELLKQVL